MKEILIYFLLPLVAIAVFIIFLKKIGVTEFIWKDKKVVFKNIPKTSLSVGNYFGLVISQDGAIRKTHLNIVINAENRSIIENFKLVIDKHITLRAKQFYADRNGLRSPNRRIELPIVVDHNSRKLRLEFEEENYNSLKLAAGTHSGKLYYSTPTRTAVCKFTIKASRSNLDRIDQVTEELNEKAKRIMESSRAGVTVVDIPIILK